MVNETPAPEGVLVHAVGEGQEPHPRPRQNKYIRFFRGLLEGFGAIALVFGIGAGFAMRGGGTTEDAELIAARSQYLAVAGRACPDESASVVPGGSTPRRFGDTPPTVQQYDCLTQKLIDAAGTPKSPLSTPR